MEIERLRARIDQVDKRVVKLIGERARLAAKIGKIKTQNEAPAFAPEREEKVFRHVEKLAAAEGIVAPEAIRAVYAEIISASRAAEHHIVVSFLGPEGTFSHKAASSLRGASLARFAARRRFGSSVELCPAISIEAVFTEVANGHADYGVVPVENSTEGGIGATLDMFMESDLKVCGEIPTKVHHALLAAPKCGRIHKIFSKAEVFGQCRNWLSNHYPSAELEDVPSTAIAAQMAIHTRGSAAIAHEDIAASCGLKVLHRAVEDSPFNITRFYVVGHDSPAPSGHDKTSILCFIRDEAGALYNILLPFSRYKVNLTRIESWPSKRKAWDYCFFIDFEGHSQDARISKVLKEVRTKCSEMKVLGSFPIGH